MKVNVKHSHRGCGNHTTITDEPYASALANIDGLATATSNATYRGVRFGSQRQSALVIYFSPWQFCAAADWEQIKAVGSGLLEVPQDKLDKILAASAAIDAEVARISGLPRVATYQCAGHSDGCCARVTVAGAYCPSCAHDNE